MSGKPLILILEDEPFILLDLELAAVNQGCTALPALNCAQAFELLDRHDRIAAAVLDVSLDQGETCRPIAEQLTARGVPFLLHTGDLMKPDGTVRGIRAPVIAKPAAASDVISAALDIAQGGSGADRRFAAE